MSALPITDTTPRLMDMKVFVLHMCRMAKPAWDMLEEHCAEYMYQKGVFAAPHHMEPIIEHMQANGVWMRQFANRLYWEDRHCYQLVIAEPFTAPVLAALRKVPAKCRAVPRDRGTFVIRTMFDGTSDPITWTWPTDEYGDEQHLAHACSLQ